MLRFPSAERGRKVNTMTKRIMIAVLVLTTWAVLIGGVWAQKVSPPAPFSGIIIKVDFARQEIVVWNNLEEKTFQGGSETRVSGPGGGELIFEDLKEGMMVTVSYREVGPSRIVKLIDIKRGRAMELPFECGPKVC